MKPIKLQWSHDENLNMYFATHGHANLVIAEWIGGEWQLSIESRGWKHSREDYNSVKLAKRAAARMLQRLRGKL